jgi:hypothetical protein
VKEHRTLGTYVTMFLEAGFTIAAMVEWGPTVEQIKTNPDWIKSRKRPLFFLMKVVKPY